MLKKLLLTSVFIIAVFVVDGCTITSLRSYWEPTKEQIQRFSSELSESHPDFSKLTISEMPCEELGRFLWYRAEICAQYLITPPDCEQPSATIMYVPPQPTFFKLIVSNEDHRLMAASSFAVISPDGELCQSQGDKQWRRTY